MKLLDLLSEARPLTARGNINAPAYAKFAGTAPKQRLTKKQQQVKDQQPVNPRQPQQPQQQQQAQQPQAQAQAQPSQQQQQTQAAVQQIAGVPTIDEKNVMKVLPALLKKAKESDQGLAREIMNVVATSLGAGEESLEQATELYKRRQEQRQAGVKGAKNLVDIESPKRLAAQANASLKGPARAEFKRMVAGMKESITEAVSGSAKQALLQQIQAAIKALTPDQRITLRSTLQHIVRGGDKMIGTPSFRGVKQAGYHNKDTTIRQRAKATGQALGQKVKAGGRAVAREYNKAKTQDFKSWLLGK